MEKENKKPTQEKEILFRHGKASYKGKVWTGVAEDGRRYVKGFHIAKKSCCSKVTKEIRKAIMRSNTTETKSEIKFVPKKKESRKKTAVLSDVKNKPPSASTSSATTKTQGPEKTESPVEKEDIPEVLPPNSFKGRARTKAQHKEETEQMKLLMKIIDRDLGLI